MEVWDNQATVAHLSSKPKFNYNAIPQNRSRADSHSRDRNLEANSAANMAPFSEGQRPKVCRFHLYFAERAKCCKPWCRWPGRKPEKMLPSSRPSSRSPSPNRSDNLN